MARDKKYSNPWIILLALVLLVLPLWRYQQNDSSDNPIQELYCYSIHLSLPDVSVDSDVGFRVTENGIIFTMQDKLCGLYEATIPQELLPDYENNWNQFCHGLLQSIEDNILLVCTENHIYNHFIVTYTDGTQTDYETQIAFDDADGSSYPIPGFSQLFMTDEIKSYLEQAVVEQREQKRRQLLLDLQLEDFEPLEGIESIIYTTSGHQERRVVTITPDRLMYEGYIDEESWAAGTPEVSLSTELKSNEWLPENWTPTEWLDIISAEETILLYHTAVQKGPASDHGKITVAFTTVDGNTYSASVEEIGICTFMMPWNVFYPLNSVPIQDTTIGTLYDSQIRLANFQKYFDKRSAEGLQPLPDLYSIELNQIGSLSFGGAYYIDSDLNVRFYKHISLPVLEEKITQAEWEQLINSKGMLIAQNDDPTLSHRDIVESSLVFHSKTEALNWHHDAEPSYSGFAMQEIVEFFEQKGYLERYDQILHDYQAEQAAETDTENTENMESE